MPFKEYFDALVLRCVNFHGLEYETPSIPLVDGAGNLMPPKSTMEARPHAGIVPGLIPDPEHDAHMAELAARTRNRGTTSPSPEPPKGLQPVEQGRYMRAQEGLAVRVYMCRVCGYVELYAEPSEFRKVEPSNG